MQFLTLFQRIRRSRVVFLLQLIFHRSQTRPACLVTSTLYCTRSTRLMAKILLKYSTRSWITDVKPIEKICIVIYRPWVTDFQEKQHFWKETERQISCDFIAKIIATRLLSWSYLCKLKRVLQKDLNLRARSKPRNLLSLTSSPTKVIAQDHVFPKRLRKQHLICH